MRITSKGRVTIPDDLRHGYGLLPGTAVEFIENDGWVGIRRLESESRDGIDDFLQRLSGSSIPVDD